MKVIDASVVVDVLTQSIALDVLGEHGLAAPHLLDSEVLQSLRGLVLAKELTAADAEAAVEAFGRLRIERHAATGLHARIWELRHNLSAYDATYVALTEALGATSLLTRDEPLSRAPGVRCRIELI